MALLDGGGGGRSRLIIDCDGAPTGGGGGGKRSSNGGLPPGVGGSGGRLLLDGGGGGAEKLGREPDTGPPGTGGGGPDLPGRLGGGGAEEGLGLPPPGSGGGPPRDWKAWCGRGVLGKAGGEHPELSSLDDTLRRALGWSGGLPGGAPVNLGGQLGLRMPPLGALGLLNLPVGGSTGPLLGPGESVDKTSQVSNY